jgi:thiamine-phosphate pyrophosphorylase
MLDSGPFLDLARAINDDVTAAGGQLVVNDRADVTALADAAGVHVGQEDLTPVDARRVIGWDKMIGLSTHSQAQLALAMSQPITYVAIGPIFSTTTKDTGYSQVGLNLVAHAAGVARAKRLPVVAIGGITLHTARAVVDAGAAAVAVITDLLHGDPEARVRQYLSALG